MHFIPFSIALLFFIAQPFAQTKSASIMQSWEYPYPVQKITLDNNLEIAYVAQGKGEQTLLFIHGLGSNLKAWKKNIDTLQHHYRCIALDLPGYGRSSTGAYPYDMTFFSNTIHNFIDILQLKNITLVGHSMGGQIAMHTILQDSSRIEKLILIDPAGFESFSEEERLWFQRIYTPAVVKATPEAQITKNFQSNFYEMPADAEFMIEDRFLLKQSSNYDAYCEMIPQCVLGMLKEPVFQDLDSIQTPTLVVFGAQDQLIPNRFLHPNLTTQQVAEAGVNQLANSQLKVVPKAGHFVQWEQSQVVNKAIIAFQK